MSVTEYGVAFLRDNGERSPVAHVTTDLADAKGACASSNRFFGTFGPSTGHYIVVSRTRTDWKEENA